MPVQAPTSALSVRNHSDIIRVAIERQFARCTTAIPGSPFDADFHAWILENVERMNDADLMVVALYRLLRLAEWTSNASFATEELRAEVARFRKAVPHLREIRDTQEHFDAYGSGTGHRQTAGEPRSGWGYGQSTIGVILTYGAFKLDLAGALKAAKQLHRALRHAVDDLAAQDVHGGPDTVIILQP